MHEYSIVSALLEQSCEIARTNKAHNIARIVISVGKHSGVDSELLANTFEVFRNDYALCQNATLEIKKQDIVILCKDCKQESTPRQMPYSKCQKCGSNAVEIIQGKDLLLLSLELETKENA